MPIDKVFVRGMRLDASIGVDDWERKTRQVIEVDVEAAVETAMLLDSGELSRGVDFTVVQGIVRELAAGAHIDLAETFADRIASAILDRTCALLVVVELRKYAPCRAGAQCCGVRVTRARGSQ
ncbi:MAG: dihydroneopterin aldolase [Deltaproteobacteria bacterium]|nr:dihydroneopterin aldolase [Deltaproteobacteria bacterium]